MKKILSIVIVSVLVGLCGCGKPLFVEPATETSLGQVEFTDAFVTGREVMSRHFELKSSDPASGIIEALPKPIDAEAERLLGGNSPARQIAKMTVYKKGQQVYVMVSVLVQRKASVSYQQPQPGDNYTGVPNQTPSQVEAATTPEQNDSWQTQSHDQGTEMQIIAEIKEALGSM